MGEVRFMISEAAKQVKVESHVLRYWEEELDLVIGRTEMGHRYYTKDDIQLFRCIKKLKDEGMLLKDLKPLIPELKLTRLKIQENAPSKLQETEKQASLKKQETIKNIKPTEAAKPLQGTSAGTASAAKAAIRDMPSHDSASKAAGKGSVPASDLSRQTDAKTPASEHLAVPAPKDKPTAPDLSQAEVIPVTQLEQVRNLIGDVLTEVVTTNNESLKKDISQSVTKEVIREMDFLFQAKERQEEEHYRKLDCLIRQQQANRRDAARETPIGRLKKLLN